MGKWFRTRKSELKFGRKIFQQNQKQDNNNNINPNLNINKGIHTSVKFSNRPGG